MNEVATQLELPTALVVLPGGKSGLADPQGARELRPPYAREVIEEQPVLVAHAAMTARRLGLNAPGRSRRIFDQTAASRQPSHASDLPDAAEKRSPDVAGTMAQRRGSDCRTSRDREEYKSYSSVVLDPPPGSHTFHRI